MYDNVTFNNKHNKQHTYIIHRKHYTTDVVNTYNINKVSNLKKTYYNLVDGVVSNTHNTIYTNGNINVTKQHNLLSLMIITMSVNDNNYFKESRTYT